MTERESVVRGRKWQEVEAGGRKWWYVVGSGRNKVVGSGRKW